MARRLYLTAALPGVMVILAGCAFGPLAHFSQDRAASRVVKAYRIPDLLAQAAPAMTDALKQNLPDGVSQAKRKQLLKAVDQAYGPKVMRGEVVGRLKRQAAKSGHEKALLKAANRLEQPLTQRMIDLEQKLAEPKFGEGFEAFANQTAGARRKRRLKVIDGLVSSMQTAELQSKFNTTLLDAMFRARNAVVDPADQLSDSRIERISNATQQRILSQLRERIPPMLLYAYRGVSTRDLKKYAAIQSSSEMVWVNKASKRAVARTLAHAGRKIVKKFNTRG